MSQTPTNSYAHIQKYFGANKTKKKKKTNHLFKIYIKIGAREARDSPSTPPSSNPAYKIEHNDEHDGMECSSIYYILTLTRSKN